MGAVNTRRCALPSLQKVMYEIAKEEGLNNIAKNFIEDVPIEKLESFWLGNFNRRKKLCIRWCQLNGVRFITCDNDDEFIYEKDGGLFFKTIRAEDGDDS